MELQSTTSIPETIKLPKMIIPDKILLQQKCMECFNYLSVGPVMINPQNKTICGRCVQNHPNKKFLRKSMFGYVAEGLVFKCIYHNQGCKTLVSYVNILEDDQDLHEHSCTFKEKNVNLQCMECSYRAQTGIQLISHLELHHPEILLTNNFDYNLGDQLHGIMQENDYLFDVNITFADNKFKVNIWSYIINDPKELKSFSLKITSPTSCVKYILVDEGKFSELLIVDVSELKNILDRSQRVTCELTFNRNNIFEEDLFKAKMELCTTQQNDLKYDTLRKGIIGLLNVCYESLLICNKCSTIPENMYVCVRGHILCKNCKICQICDNSQVPFDITENLYKDFGEIPCEWKGCKEKSGLTYFLSHKISCNYRIYTCPYSTCEFTSKLDIFAPHFFGHCLNENVSVSYGRDISVSNSGHEFYWVLNDSRTDIVKVSTYGSSVKIDMKKSPMLRHQYRFFVEVEITSYNKVLYIQTYTLSHWTGTSLYNIEIDINSKGRATSGILTYKYLNLFK